MRAGYIDTSVLVGIAFDEPAVASIIRVVKSFDRLYSATLLEAEFLAAASREGVLDQALTLLRPIRWVFPTRRLTDEVFSILDRGYLRGTDLHHLSTALYLFPDASQAFFLTLDKKQSRMAQSLGFKTLSSGEEG